MAGNYDSFPDPDEYLDLQDGPKGRAAYGRVCAGICTRQWYKEFLKQDSEKDRQCRVCSAVRDCPEYTSEGAFDSVCNFTG